MKLIGKALIGGGIVAVVLIGAAALLHSPVALRSIHDLPGHAGIHANGRGAAGVPVVASGPAAELVGSEAGDVAANARALAGVAAIGTRWDRQALVETVALYADVHRSIEWPGVLPAETVRYGPSPQQDFDLYVPEQPFSEPGPVFLLLHGDGLGGSGRTLVGSEGLFHAHLGKLGAVAGGIGVSMDYRAPQEFARAGGIATLASLENGAADLRRVVEWIAENIDDYGGDPETVVLIANAEAATVAAAYLFNETWQPQSGHGIAAAVLASGVFGARAPQIEEFVTEFDGDPVPLALWSGEYDAAAISNGIVWLDDLLCAKYAACPVVERFPGHNRLSYLLSMGTADTLAMNAFIGFYHTVR